MITATFYAQAGLSALLGVLGFFVIPAEIVQQEDSIPLAEFDREPLASPGVNKRFDWIGTVLSVSGLVLLTFSLAYAARRSARE